MGVNITKIGLFALLLIFVICKSVYSRDNAGPNLNMYPSGPSDYTDVNIYCSNNYNYKSGIPLFLFSDKPIVGRGYHAPSYVEFLEADGLITMNLYKSSPSVEYSNQYNASFMGNIDDVISVCLLEDEVLILTKDIIFILNIGDYSYLGLSIPQAVFHNIFYLDEVSGPRFIILSEDKDSDNSLSYILDTSDYMLHRMDMGYDFSDPGKLDVHPGTFCHKEFRKCFIYGYAVEFIYNSTYRKFSANSYSTPATDWAMDSDIEIYGCGRTKLECAINIIDNKGFDVENYIKLYD